jgi:hypothetical protein
MFIYLTYFLVALTVVAAGVLLWTILTDKPTVQTKHRELKAEYTMELAQDLEAVHGLNAETELTNILSTPRIMMKTVEQQIEVMQAFAAGKTIKRTSHFSRTLDSEFKKHCNPKNFNWTDFDYDIVEEPIVKYMVVVSSDGSTVCDYNRYEVAKEKLEGIPDGNYKIIKLVQDMDFKGDDE